jgi:hypothetical protein
MNMLVTIITSAITGGLAGAVFNYFIAPCIRKRAFRSYIRSVQFDLEALMLNWKHLHPGNPYFLYDWQKETAARIAPRTADVLEDIRAKHRPAFMELLWQFTRQGRRDVEPFEGKQPDKPLLYSDQQTKLKDILEKMIEYGKCSTK